MSPAPNNLPPKATLEDKIKAARAAAKELEKRFGDGAIIRMGDKVNIKIPCIPSGIYSLDHFVIQAGGIPRGRITEIYGPESGGKTSLALTVIAQAQKLGGLAAFIDAEHALDPTYAQALGVDVENLYISQPDSGEQALETTEALIRSGAFDIVAIDSVAALVPQAELDGEMGDAPMGLQARLMSQAMRKLTGVVSKTNTALVFINQVREKIGVMYGNPEVTTGGRALKFYASLRLDIRRVSTQKDGDVAIENTVKIKAAKNKVGAPFRVCEVNIEFGKGFDLVGSYIDAGVLNGVLSKSGAWFVYEGEKIQGKDAMVAYFKDNPEKYPAFVKAVEAADERVAA